MSRRIGFFRTIFLSYYFFRIKLISSSFFITLSKLIALFFLFSNNVFFFSSSSLNFVTAWPSSLNYLSLKVDWLFLTCTKLLIVHFGRNLSASFFMLSSPSNCSRFCLESKFKVFIFIALRLRHLVHLRDSRAFYFLLKWFLSRKLPIVLKRKTVLKFSVKEFFLKNIFPIS